MFIGVIVGRREKRETRPQQRKRRQHAGPAETEGVEADRARQRRRQQLLLEPRALARQQIPANRRLQIEQTLRKRSDFQLRYSPLVRRVEVEESFRYFHRELSRLPGQLEFEGGQRVQQPELLRPTENRQQSVVERFHVGNVAALVGRAHRGRERHRHETIFDRRPRQTGRRHQKETIQEAKA